MKASNCSFSNPSQLFLNLVCNPSNLNSSAKFDIKDFTLGRKLGEGKFGHVFLAKENQSQFICALKMIRKYNEDCPDLLRNISREIQIQKFLYHTNIVRLFNYFYNDQKIFIIFEFLPKGCMTDELKRFDRFCLVRSATYIYQLADAVHYFHSKDVIHRDIKSDNILIGSRGQAKITDFGNAVHIPGSKLNKFCGTIDYIAPEVSIINDQDLADNPVYDQRSDIWSIGIFLYQMLVGFVPFEGIGIFETLEKIKKCEITFPDSLTPDSVEFLKCFLQGDPKARIASIDINRHAWIEKYAEKSFTQCKKALEAWKTLEM